MANGHVLDGVYNQQGLKTLRSAWSSTQILMTGDHKWAAIIKDGTVLFERHMQFQSFPDVHNQIIIFCSVCDNQETNPS